MQRRLLLKLADIAESASTSPLPQLVIPTTPAPTSKGPRNQKQLPDVVENVSRVNTGIPVPSNATEIAQKSIPPPPVNKVASEDTMSKTLISDLVQMAKQGSASRLRQQEFRQQSKLASGDAEKPEDAEKKKKSEDDEDEPEKTAEANLPTEYVTKLAHAVRHIVKMSSEVGPGSGPNALAVSVAQDGKPTAQPGQQGAAHTQPPAPTTAPVRQGDSSTALQTTANNPPGGGGTQGSALSGGRGKVAKVLKVAAAIKSANDGMTGSVPGGTSSTDPPTTAALEGSGKPAGGAPQGPSGLVSSNQSAIDYTRGQAYANRKDDLRAYLNEAPLSAATDKTLSQSFDHTSQAGPKIASRVDELAKTAASRALVSRLIEDAKGGR